MDKDSKDISRKDLKPYVAVGILNMKHGEATTKDLFEHVTDLKKFYNWVNFFPHTWLSSKDKHFHVGLSTTFRVIFPPMTYKFIVTEVLPDCTRINFDIRGWMNGNGMWEFIESEDGIQCRHTMFLTGINWLMHKYYAILKRGHDVYLPWRFSILKKILIKNSEKEKQGVFAK